MALKILKKRHVFHFKSPAGRSIRIRVPAKVRAGNKKVRLVLTADHVRRSLQLDGQGNPGMCGMAICSLEHGHLFSHPLIYVEWVYNRAYFAHKTKNGLPSECVVYEHYDKIAPTFDKGAASARKLLKDLEENGPKVITLYPPRKRKRDQTGRARGLETGERTRLRPLQPRGAHLRLQQLQLGLTSKD